MSSLKDLTGQRFGRLTVIERVGWNVHKDSTWRCLCDCGNLTVKSSPGLRNGKNPSCGCWKKERISETKTKHGKSGTRLYGIWKAMNQRCNNPNHRKYRYYGGKGITVCDEWAQNFQTFFEWSIENGYTDSLTIDRIDNNKGYSPENCQWETVKHQHNHTSGNRFITYNGETHSLAEWGEKVNIKPGVIWDRLARGWAVERALTTRPKGESKL